MLLNLRRMLLPGLASGLGLLVMACSNPATSTTSVTVSVTGASSVALGSTSQYAAKVTGSSNQAVTWTVNQASGGNAQVGTISTVGLYSAPAAMPSSGAVTIAAVSAADSSISGIISVALKAATTPATSTLSINPTSVAFQDVVVNTSATQSVTLASTGTEPVTIDGAALTGTGFTVSGITFPLTLNPSQTATLSVQFSPTTAGAATGQMTVSSNSSASGTTVISLNGLAVPGSSGPSTAASFTYSGSQLIHTRVPTNPSAAISRDFFGMTIRNLAPNSLDFTPGMTPFPPFPVSFLRFWDVVYWAMIDTYEGQNNWTKLDNSMAIAKQNGVSDFIFTFGRVPAWASTSPTDPCATGEGVGTCTFPNMDALDSFAARIVQRYCGVIKYYEPWNEPNNPQFWDGTKAQLLTIAQHVYQIAKDPSNCGCTNGSCSPNGGVNPNQVLLPAISNLSPTSVEWLDSYLAGAGAQYPYADIAAFHGYGYINPEDMVSGIPLLRQTLAKYGLSDLELWDTETGWEPYFDLDQQQQTSWLMRYHTMLVVEGISRFGWYAYDQCFEGTLWSSPLCTNLPGPTGQLTEAGNAYAAIEDWFIGANLTQCQQYLNGLWACELRRSGNYDAWMLWSSTGTDIPVPIPPNFGLTVYRDSQNNLAPLPPEITVNQTPVLVENNDL